MSPNCLGTIYNEQSSSHSVDWCSATGTEEPETALHVALSPLIIRTMFQVLEKRGGGGISETSIYYLKEKGEQGNTLKIRPS